MTFFLVMYFLDIQILPASSLASDIRNRAEIVESYIDSYYWKDDVSDQTISEYAAKGMVAALGDKYSAYFTSEELKSSMEDVEGDYEGIGASVRYDEKTKNKTIQEVQKGRPAQKAGLKAGDILMEIDGKDLAGKNNAIVAASGDFFVFKRSGLAIRNGKLYREELNRSQDVCVVYFDGTMATYFAGSVDLDSIYAKNPYHAFSFGPKLLNNGEPMTEFNTSVATWNPRCAIGYYEPGHYCLVVVDGRQRGYSLGLEMTELSKLMKQLGCTEAYNLDGGMTAMMAYGTELYSQPCGGGRQNCDIVYVAEPLS